MPRKAREKSETGIYHVVLRGADRRTLFYDDEDSIRFLSSIRDTKKKTDFKLYAYCLMGNHVHLLIHEQSDSMEAVFKSILCSYVYYYNRKYELQGHLLQDRYRSEPIRDDAYFMDVLRYICLNPVKAGLCAKPFDYRWLGCSGITTGDALLDSIEELTDLGKEELLTFVGTRCAEEHLDVNGTKRPTDREAAELICKLCGTTHAQEIGGYDDVRRDAALAEILKAGISIRQLSRLTAVSKAVIERIAKK